MPALSRRGDRIESETGGVGPGLARHEHSAGAVGPDFELLDGRGAERVAGGKHHAAALIAQSRRKLADRCRLARTVDASDQDDERPFRRIDGKRLGDVGERFLDLAGNHFLDFLGADRGVEAAVSEFVGDAAGGLGAQIGPDQFVFDLHDRRLVERAFGNDMRNGAAERRRTALEPRR